MKEKIHVIITSVVLLILCLFLSEAHVIRYGQWFYLIQLVVIINSIFKHTKNFIYIFSPSFITLAYLNISFFLGHYVVAHNIGFDAKYYHAFKNFESVSFITAFFLISNLMVFLALNFNMFEKTKNNLTLQSKTTFTPNKISIFILFFVLVFLSFIHIDLAIIGGKGDFSYLFKLSTSIIILILIMNSGYNKITRLIYYLLIIAFIFIGSYTSKREILYPIIFIIFLEILSKRITIKIRVKQLIMIGIGIFFILYIFVVSSILRGYGNFETNNPLVASSHVLEYLSSDYAVNALTSNFELNTVYGNSANAINYVYSDQVDLLYGLTFLKTIFIFLPRSVFPDKPSSMIDIYTSTFNPFFRSTGGSLPIVIYSESFWNFSLFALPFLYFFYSVINKLYLKLINRLNNNILNLQTVVLSFMYVTLIQFIRGSGLELWILYGLLSIPFIFIVLKIITLKKKS